MADDYSIETEIATEADLISAVELLLPIARLCSWQSSDVICAWLLAVRSLCQRGSSVN